MVRFQVDLGGELACLQDTLGRRLGREGCPENAWVWIRQAGRVPVHPRCPDLRSKRWTRTPPHKEIRAFRVRLESVLGSRQLLTGQPFSRQGDDPNSPYLLFHDQEANQGLGRVWEVARWRGPFRALQGGEVMQKPQVRDRSGLEPAQHPPPPQTHTQRLRVSSLWPWLPPPPT